MAKAQRNRFTEEQQELSNLAKAFSHPARIAIIEVLTARDVCICGELVEALPLSQATVSQHLKVLKEVGLVTGEIDGPKSCYCVDWNTLARAQASVIEWFTKTGCLTKCC